MIHSIPLHHEAMCCDTKKWSADATNKKWNAAESINSSSKSLRKRMQERQRQLRLQQQQREEEMERLQNKQLMRERRREQCRRDANAFPPGTIIRGRDGRLYRVVVDPHLNDDDASIHSNGSASVQSSSCSDSVQTNTDEMEVEHRTDEKIRLNATANEFIPKDASKSAPMKVTNDKFTKKKQFTLTVEDVPFEEDEELKDLHSVWRNRAPSPGEWMEPVDSFDK
jgi:hypothetical protein